VGAVGLFWDLAPQYRPDPLDSVGADVEVIAVEPRVTLRGWLRRAHGADVDGAARDVFGRRPSASELALRGELLYVRTQVDGHKHRDISLRYEIYDRSTQRPVEVPLPPYLTRLQRARLAAPSQRSVQLLWMPNLQGEGDLFVRVALSSERGLLAVTDSGTLRDGLLTN
jgi:hypothetical protein